MKRIFLLLVSLFVLSCSSDDSSDSSNELATPDLITPSDNATITVEWNDTSSREFVWGEIATATRYLIQISSDSNFETIVKELYRNVNEQEPYDNTTAYFTLDDLEDGQYYWRVKAFGEDNQESDYSQVYAFTLINNSNCDFCFSDYYGTFDATIDGESVSNRAMEVFIYQPGENGLHDSAYRFNFGSFNNWQQELFTISGALQNDNTLIYENRVWDIDGTSVTINGTVTFSNNFTMLSGDFTLTGGHSGTINFSASL